MYLILRKTIPDSRKLHNTQTFKRFESSIDLGRVSGTFAWFLAVISRRDFFQTMAALPVKSLETLAFDAVPSDDMLKFLAEVWPSPLRLQYWGPFKQNLSLTEMSWLAKLLPWDHPATRDLDFTVHKKRMQGKTRVSCGCNSSLS